MCNSYLVDQQESAGWLMVKLALLLFAAWLGSLFVGGGGSPVMSAAEHVAPRSAQRRESGPERN